MSSDSMVLDAVGRRQSGAPQHTWTRVQACACVANLAIAIVIVAAFHNRFLAAADDGAYAYLADALLNGAVLNRDIHDVHGGYVHFVHALAFEIFGRDLVSLRYPLAALTVVQSLIVFILLRPMIGAWALLGGLAMSSLTFVQFLNPTANWYALFLAVVVAGLLAARAQRAFSGLVAIGLVIGLIFLFRQLTGVLVAMGAVAWLLAADDGGPRAVPPSSPALGRVVAAVMALGLAVYFATKTNAIAFLLYGLFPLGVLALVSVRSRTGNRRTLEVVGGLATGAVLAAAPLLAYHAASGSLVQWWHDTTVSAIALTDLEFFGQFTYGYPAMLATLGVVGYGGFAAFLNGIFWLLVLLAPAILGMSVLVRMLAGGTSPHPLAIVALFHAVVSAHYAIPIYAVLSTGLAFAGLLTLAKQPAARFAASATILYAVAIGVIFQAGQPLERGYAGIIRGDRMDLDAYGLPGASLNLTQSQQKTYRELIAFVDAHADAEDTILGLPMTPQLYYFTGRRPPVRFIIAPLGLLSDGDVDEAWQKMKDDLPAVVFFRPDDKYTTPRVRDLMDLLRPHYRLCDAVAGFELHAADCQG